MLGLTKLIQQAINSRKNTLRKLNCFVALFTLLGATFSVAPIANAQRSSFTLGKGQLYCPYDYKETLAAIIDAGDEDELKEKVIDSVMRGRCIPSTTLTTVINLKQESTLAGNTYICFDHYEQDSDANEKSNLHRFCSVSIAVKELAEDIQSRTGEFRIIVSNDKFAKAECSEGGTVLIFLTPEGIRRQSMVFPIILSPIDRKVSCTLNDAIRDGCRGVDYQN